MSKRKSEPVVEPPAAKRAKALTESIEAPTKASAKVPAKTPAKALKPPLVRDTEHCITIKDGDDTYKYKHKGSSKKLEIWAYVKDDETVQYGSNKPIRVDELRCVSSYYKQEKSGWASGVNILTGRRFKEVYYSGYYVKAYEMEATDEYGRTWLITFDAREEDDRLRLRYAKFKRQW
jgi:hypothetical protein